MNETAKKDWAWCFLVMIAFFLGCLTTHFRQARQAKEPSDVKIEYIRAHFRELNGKWMAMERQLIKLQEWQEEREELGQ